MSGPIFDVVMHSYGELKSALKTGRNMEDVPLVGIQLFNAYNRLDGHDPYGKLVFRKDVEYILDATGWHKLIKNLK